MTRIAAATTLAFVTLAGLATTAAAHRPSESHLTLTPAGDHIDARWDLSLRDLDWALSLDGDGDGRLTWGEVEARQSTIAAYATAGIQFTTGSGRCPVEPGRAALVEHSDGAYLSLPLGIRCAAGLFTVSYSLFFDMDPQHRALVRADDGSDRLVILSSGSRSTTLPLTGAAAPAAAASVFTSFVRQGVHHIAIGLDHVLFLLVLLLPAVLRREEGRWIPAASLGAALGDVAKIVSAFTAAHALTMSAAALGIVSVPSRLIEPAIAVSVVLAAANNVWPLFDRARWTLPFTLGLLHGFGFSSVLADIGLPRGHLVTALVGFNVGVELGQLALVTLVVPVAFLLRRTIAYRRFALIGGSLAVAAIALVWFVERVFDIPLVS